MARSPSPQIGKLNKGTLGAFGYSNVMTLNLDQRRRALKKAVKKLGRTIVVKKLNAVYILNRNKDPKRSNRFRIDKEWVMNNF